MFLVLFLFYLHLVANEMKLLLSASSQDKPEFLLITIIFFYCLCFSSLHSSKPLQSSLTSTFMFPEKVATFPLQDFNIFILAAAAEKFQQLLDRLYVYSCGHRQGYSASQNLPTNQALVFATIRFSVHQSKHFFSFCWNQ